MTKVLKVIGIDEYNERIARPYRRRVYSGLMNTSVGILHSAIAKYPPPRPRSRYRRTGTLGRRWTKKVARDGLTGTVGNNTRYGPFVQSEEFQARIHRGVWQTDVQVVSENENRIRNLWQRRIDRELR